MPFSLGSDPLSSGLSPSILAANAPTIFGYQLPTIPNPFDYLPNNPVSGAINTAGNVASGIGSAYSQLTSAELWERVGLVILGMIFIAIALFMFGNAPVRAAIERVTP